MENKEAAALAETVIEIAGEFGKTPEAMAEIMLKPLTVTIARTYLDKLPLDYVGAWTMFNLMNRPKKARKPASKK